MASTAAHQECPRGSPQQPRWLANRGPRSTGAHRANPLALGCPPRRRCPGTGRRRTRRGPPGAPRWAPRPTAPPGLRTAATRSDHFSRRAVGASSRRGCLAVSLDAMNGGPSGASWLAGVWRAGANHWGAGFWLAGAVWLARPGKAGEFLSGTGLCFTWSSLLLFLSQRPKMRSALCSTKFGGSVVYGFRE